MNVLELKQEIMNLAFEESAAMKEYSDIVLNAINRSIRIIANTVRPILGKAEIRQEGDAETEYVRYDMNELAQYFIGFADKIVLETPDGRYATTVDYRTEEPAVLLLPGRVTGRFTVWYKRIPKKITIDTSDKEELELDRDVHLLVPLLASYYVWLDDDERKAAYFKNDYEDLKVQMNASRAAKPMAAVEGGMRW